MHRSLEFVLSLLDSHDPAFVSAEDFAGPHGRTLRLWQQLGLLSNSPERHPLPSCSFCQEGVPYALGERSLCGTCHSLLEESAFLRWRFDLAGFLTWVSQQLGLRNDLEQVNDQLWQLGILRSGEHIITCFFWRGGALQAPIPGRLFAFRNALLFHAVPSGERIEGFHGLCLTLLEVLALDGNRLRVTSLEQFLHRQGRVRFEAKNGSLWIGERCLGDVPLGSKEHAFLACLMAQVDQYVPYADLKQAVLRATGRKDMTDEATFCQKLKSRIKRRIPYLDRLLVTTNKGEGYRLRGWEH